MKNLISRFFTLYWIIYFPTCIAFNDLPGFSSIDELMTGLIILFAFAVYIAQNRKWRKANKMIWNEYMIFFAILAFYIIYSIALRTNVVQSVWYDLIQQIRPWSVIYCTWLLNPQFTNRQKHWLLGTMIITLISMLFYNPQITDFDSEFRIAPFGQLAICTSMAWYLFTKKTQKNKYITVAIAVFGILSFKFKYYGEFGAWMFLLFFIKKKFDLKSSKLYVELLVLLIVVLALGWERFDAYYISGANDTGLARPMMLKTGWIIMCRYFPFGSGLGTFGTASSAVYYSPLYYQYGLNEIWGLGNYGVVAFHCDSFIATFAQIGFIGAFLFLWFWKRRISEFNKIYDLRYYKVAMMAFFCIVIEWFGDSSFLSGKGMGYLLLIGVCLNANRNLTDAIKRKQLIESRKKALAEKNNAESQTENIEMTENDTK